MAIFKAIAAMSLDRVIGYKNTIPWNIPEELQWFRKKTLGHAIVMGRKTFESLGNRPLPNRTNYVLSRGSFSHHGVITINDIQTLKQEPNLVVWLCGGASIYRKFLPLCTEIFLTTVLRHVEGDTFFPEIPKKFNYVGKISETPQFYIEHWTI